MSFEATSGYHIHTRRTESFSAYFLLSGEIIKYLNTLATYIALPWKKSSESACGSDQ